MFTTKRERKEERRARNAEARLKFYAPYRNDEREWKSPKNSWAERKMLHVRCRMLFHSNRDVDDVRHAIVAGAMAMLLRGLTNDSDRLVSLRRIVDSRTFNIEELREIQSIIPELAKFDIKRSGVAVPATWDGEVLPGARA